MSTDEQKKTDEKETTTQEEKKTDQKEETGSSDKKEQDAKPSEEANGEKPGGSG